MAKEAAVAAPNIQKQMGALTAPIGVVEKLYLNI
jgi:hypothetical protein